MVRWEPGTRDRLQEAALELYDSRGFEETTAADIARAVGLTERTFFRHFADKREVLFDGQEFFQAAFVSGVEKAPSGAAAIEIVTSALESAAAFFPAERRDYSRLRQRIIVANPALQERELLKMAGLARTLAAAIRGRGVPDPQATLAAETGVTVFGVAFLAWLEPGEERPFFAIETAVLDELTALTGGPSAAAPRA
ncbi:TetR family transcriptional regulator [Frondihabitans sucicola]|uniref:TetR family transcriptional regulator n=1 Tax=Frondihabitans sucicola TaxID=1268041 RepID=A0ABN6Y1R1_9MICO|nr:TetR family transcriptional regulator [Frondihabitans sucicola]BDZ51269.1 TetR family transcriptional regulator [Frondihabitans sucicola]